jgi:hypothetical protein
MSQEQGTYMDHYIFTSKFLIWKQQKTSWGLENKGKNLVWKTEGVAVKMTFFGRSTCSLFYAPSTQLCAHSLPPIFPLVCMGSSAYTCNCIIIARLSHPSSCPPYTAPAFGSAFGHTEASSSSNLAEEELLVMTCCNTRCTVTKTKCPIGFFRVWQRSYPSDSIKK